MEEVAVGTRWDTAGIELPPIAPMPERGPMGAELWLNGHLVVNPSNDPVVEQVADRAGEVRWLAAMSARYDRRLADTYLRGAGELASRAPGGAAERREWGARSMLAELACALRLPETTLARRLARITMLAAFPQLVAAAESGRVSSWHCDVMLDVFAGVTDAAVLARADAALIDRAQTATAPQLRASARRWRARHVPRTEEQRRAALADRRVELTPADEDMVWLSALIPAPAAVAIDRRLDAIADAAVQEPDEGRTHEQVRADALVGLLLDPAVARIADGRRRADADDDRHADHDDRRADDEGADDDERADHERADDERADDKLADDERADAGDEPWANSDGCPVPGWVRAIRPEVILTVPVLSLLGHSDEPAELEGFGPIDMETATMLAAHARSFVRVLTHPETGAVLSVGRDRYRIPADLRRVVELRDATCRFPGCARRARRCDVDHTRAWEHGGESEVCNLACLCRTHHRVKHQTDWQVSQGPGGVLSWRSPLGLQYRTEPVKLWPPPPDAERSPSFPGETSPVETRSAAGDGRRVRRRPRAVACAPVSSAHPDVPPF